jgi:succinoglycan biosynthesis transport protein ExoP
MDLVYLIKIFTKRRWFILFVTLSCTVLAFIFSLFSKEAYRSQAQISTGYTQSQEITMSDNIFDQGQIEVKFNNVIENMGSTKVLSILSYKLILNDLKSGNPFSKIDTIDLKKKKKFSNFVFAAAVNVFQHKYDSLTVLRSDIPTEKILLELLNVYGYNLESIRKMLDVYRLGRTDYIDIVSLTAKAELSEFMVNNLISEFQRYNNITKRARSVESMSSLDSIERIKKAELDEKIYAKSAFLRDSVSTKLDPSIIGASKLSQVGSYETGLAEEIARLQSINYQLEQVNQQLQTSSSLAAESAPEMSTNKLYYDLRKQYNNLYDEYVKGGSSDEDVKTKLDDLQRRMRNAATTSSAKTTKSNNTNQLDDLNQSKIDLEASLRSTNSKISFYRTKLGETRSIIVGSSNKSSGRLEYFDKEIELATTEYANAKERKTLVSNIDESGLSNFKQTLFGQVALEPEPSKRFIVVALSGFSGFLLTSFVFILLAYLDPTIKNPLQFQRMTGLPILGTINFVDLEGTTLKEHITQIDTSDSNRNNAFRELLRKLRYEIEMSGKRIIMFTSTEPQQGKTTLLQSLAFSLSLSNKKILIIDTNFCNNDLTIYNKAKPTLERFSASEKGFDLSNVKQLISKTKIENVDIIGCRGGDYTPSEILPKNHVLNFLNDFLVNYDFILMEGAPLNGFTDTKELAKYAEGVVAIFSAKSQIKPIDKESIKYFKTIPTKFLGAVLNQVSSEELSFTQKKS